MIAAGCPPHGLRPAGPGDTVAGRQARLVAAPTGAMAVAGVLSSAAQEGLAVAPRGAGSKLDWGPVPARVDVLLDLAGLTGPTEHQPEDQTATFAAGTPLRAALASLSDSGRRLPLDPGSVSATIGGLLATDEAGPLGYRFGAPSRQLVGAEVALASGELVTVGPDLAPLLCGSTGALAVITSATFRTVPRPTRRLWLRRRVRTPLELHDLVTDLVSTDLPLAAIEVDLPAVLDPGTLCVLLEGEPALVAAAAELASGLLGGEDVQASPAAPNWWGSYPFHTRHSGHEDIALRITAPPGQLHAAIYALRDAAGRAVPVRGSVGVGSVFAALPGNLPTPVVAGILEATRHTLLARGGRLLVLRAPLHQRELLDFDGPAPGAALGARLKQALDPAAGLAARWPGAR